MAEDGCIFRFINMVLDRAPQTLALLSVLGLLVVLPPILSSTYAAPDRKAADQGNASAQYNLGLTYDRGQGVAQDYTQALFWYRKAADQGEASAQYNLGVTYERGQGAAQDYTQALFWYRKAADQGHALAQGNLGVMYEWGEGVVQNFVQAHKWFNIAAAHLTGAARESEVKNRGILERKMTQAQVAEAQKIAQEWKPKTD